MARSRLMVRETRPNSVVSAAAFCILDVAFRRLFDELKLTFPPSLGGCGVLFGTLLLLRALSKDAAESVYKKLLPGAELLAKWLPVFFVPSLVTLPLAEGLSSSAELIKVAIVVVGGFLVTLLTTSFSVVSVRQLLSLGGNNDQQDKEEDPLADVDDPLMAMSIKAVQYAEKNVVLPSQRGFSNTLMRNLWFLTFASGAGALGLDKFTDLTEISKRLKALFLLSTTLTSFVFGSRLPVSFKKLIHPLVTCTAMTWAGAAGLAAATGKTFHSVLKYYRTGSMQLWKAGAGDVLLFLLGPAVVSLAISMYGRRRLMRDNIAEVGTAVSVSTAGGIFGTALAVRLLNLSNPYLRLSMLSRNITSPLAIAIASILGADVSLAVSMVVVTGLIGANFGASILDAFGVKDPVARGLGIGAAAHGLGTAAFANEKDAFPFAAIAMALTASAATVTVSIPVLRKIILQLALGS